ncbi:MAG: NADH-quinone oxidoreductase subunit G [Nitrospirae bacterium]|nr:MAG: NADH-quinone oxidoreductase subunit G [Nitrospirota bacterium]
MTKKPVENTVSINGRPVAIEGERNLLEIIRKAGIDLPTFCYHSDLSVYGACRLCLVEIEGRGIVGSCSTPPEPGMKIKTHTEEIREIRKISVELLLANHDNNCPTCYKSNNCQLQRIARQLGVESIRFGQVLDRKPVDTSSPSVTRDPNKCVLCGDCVRVCSEIQEVGAIDFAHRGHQASVLPAFGKDLGEVECVNCGQCTVVCPTGALTPRSEMEEVWKDLMNPDLCVVVCVAPAVRVGLGESFEMDPGTITTGQMAASLKMLGFDQVYDTSFAADLTIFEEGSEFLQRKAKGEKLPQFTSCCPGWVKFTEQYYPELLEKLSTCKSPQQMFGALLKDRLPEMLGIAKEKIRIVSVMPCTAKKYEAKRPEFIHDGIADVDHVITTQELARMIKAAGILFSDLTPESFDMPFGFATGAGVLFGNSGGVTEAVLRFAAEKVTGKQLQSFEFKQVRGESGLREAAITIDGVQLKLAVVSGLKNAKTVAEQVRKGTCEYDIVEVMACPQGCIGGAGQPVSRNPHAKKMRTKGIYDADKMMPLHKSQENIFVADCYAKFLGDVGGDKAHHLLHTHYQSRRRLPDEGIAFFSGNGGQRLKVDVCLGTNCFIKGAQDVLNGLLGHAEEHKYENMVDIRASFCFEQCEEGPTVKIGAVTLNHATVDTAVQALSRELEHQLSGESAAKDECTSCSGCK